MSMGGRAARNRDVAMRTVMGVALAGLLAAPAMAAGYDMVRARPHAALPAAHRPELPAIYENFAWRYPKGVFNASTGASVGGPMTLHGQIWLAAGFTPARDARVQEIDLAAGFIAGSKNLVQVGLYADAGGAPGALIWSGRTALPLFGACCGLVVLKPRVAPAVRGGAPYWVGVTTLPGVPDLTAAWNLEVLDQIDPGPAAQNRGSGWVSGPSTPPFAFGVYGR